MNACAKPNYGSTPTPRGQTFASSNLHLICTQAFLNNFFALEEELVKSISPLHLPIRADEIIANPAVRITLI